MKKEDIHGELNCWKLGKIKGYTRKEVYFYFCNELHLHVINTTFN